VKFAPFVTHVAFGGVVVRLNVPHGRASYAVTCAGVSVELETSENWIDFVADETYAGLRVFALVAAAAPGTVSVNFAEMNPAGTADAPPPSETTGTLDGPCAPPLHAARNAARTMPVIARDDLSHPNTIYRDRCFALPVIDDVVYVTTNVGSVFV
jgi:hypothetical protein